MLADRYASFDGGKGKEFEDGSSWIYITTDFTD